MRTFLLLCLAACSENSVPHQPELLSPSGYQNDPWSVHLYALYHAHRIGDRLQLLVTHNPEFEGNANDDTIPPPHDYLQQLTVDVPFDEALRRFVCVVLAPSTTPPSYALSELSGIARGPSTLLYDGSANLINLEAMCGSSLPAEVPSMQLTQAALPDLALMIPLAPDPRQLATGAQVSGWVARGVMYIDEDRELQPEVRATVVSVQ